MDTQRLVLFVLLSIVLFMIWQAWYQDYGPPPPPSVASQGADSKDVPSRDLPGATPTSPEAGVPAPAAQKPFRPGSSIHVATDVLDVEISSVGGDIRGVKLPTFPVAVDKRDEPFQLMNDTLPNIFIAQSGLLSSVPSPDHHAEYVPESTEYRLAEGATALTVRLHWNSPEGLTVIKSYTFHRGSYVINLDYEVKNAGAEDWKGRSYRQFQRTDTSSQKSGFGGVYTYTGGVIYSNEAKYEKIAFKDMKDANLSRDIRGGWAAMIQHYFLGAWLPGPDEPNHYYSKVVDGDRYILGMVSPEMAVPAGGSSTFSTQLYVGPKLQDHLAKVAPGLELTVDYGILTIISQPLFWLLKYIHKLVGNWGWAIVLLTFLIKLVFYKLSETSYRSMANMKRLQPRLMALKERYGDDRQKLNQAMMGIYKTEKINPLGGCLPIVVQIPVFIALYWMLLESVELRQADFMFWIHDLSAKDPFYVLPIIMGASMLVQHKLNPAPIDPVQQKVMMLLPIVFTVFFAFFPAGLVLYWITNNVLSISQQWVITKRIAGSAT